MEFTKPSDIGLFDGFTEWYHFAIEAVIVVAVIAFIALIVRHSDFKETTDIFIAAFFSLSVLLFTLVTPINLQGSAIIDARNENVSKVFNVPDDQKYEMLEDYRSKDDVFSDVKTTIKDADAQVMYEVTFGFKESGEPFIYETGEVNKEFIEKLKR